MSALFVIVIFVILLAIVFDFVNGFHDAANIVATIISSRSMSAETALVIAAACEFLGPLLFGTAVAKTIGKGLIDPAIIDEYLVLAALTGAIAWNLITWKVGLPSSSSHALVGGIIGTALAATGTRDVQWEGFGLVVIVLITSPIIGFFVGALMQMLFTYLARGQSPRANIVFKKGQLVTAVGMALSHGANDAQKSMGVITMILVASTASGVIPEWAGFLHLNAFEVPFWVIVVCALAMGMGTATGGWSIIKTVGGGIYKLRPIHGFSSQAASAVVIMNAALWGFPVSTTHIASSSIMGVGSADRIKAVRWHKAREIVATWFITIPAAGIISAVTFAVLTIVRDIL